LKHGRFKALAELVEGVVGPFVGLVSHDPRLFEQEVLRFGAGYGMGRDRETERQRQRERQRLGLGLGLALALGLRVKG
jgi:hypothetical protein